jgi:alpha-1,3-rhamnosyl/mannosyltransferase
MRVVVNRQWTLGPRTGIGHYTAELLTNLAVLAGNQVQAYPTGWMWKLLQGWTRANAGSNPTHRASSWTSKLSPRRLVGQALAVPSVRAALRASLEAWQFHHFEGACNREDYDLYHEPNMLPMPCSRATITTLHDLSVITHPEWHPTSRVRWYDKHFARTLSQCVHFLTVSDYARKEIIEILGVPASAVTRVYNGIRTGLAPMSADNVAAGLKALGLPPTYLLHVGALEIRKNLEMLVRAYCDLPEPVRARCPMLLVGQRAWNTPSLATLLDGEARHRGVIHVGYVAEEQLPLLYNGARALLFPSLHEGFGLPAVEMLACGGAVLASTAGALPEVVGGHGHLIDPNDLDEWRDAMKQVIVDEEWRQSLRRGGTAWASQFTWQSCARQTFRVYEQALGKSPTQSIAA